MMIIEAAMDTELSVSFCFTYSPGSPPSDDDPGAGPDISDIELHFNGQQMTLRGSAYDAAEALIREQYSFVD